MHAFAKKEKHGLVCEAKGGESRIAILFKAMAKLKAKPWKPMDERCRQRERSRAEPEGAEEKGDGGGRGRREL